VTGRYGRALTVIAAVGSGLAAGVFFAFSTFVMTALDRLPDRQGLLAMQEINDVAPTPWFMVPFIGTALVGVVLVVLALRRPSDLPVVNLVVGSVLYVAGVVVTVAYHVPNNDDLALVDPSSPGAADAWNDYRTPWTAWNHVRTVLFLGAAIAFTVALVASRRSATRVTASQTITERAEPARAASTGVSG
jgi:uncharacterized membrane protein